MTCTRTRTAVLTTVLGLGAALTASCTGATADDAGPAVAASAPAPGPVAAVTRTPTLSPTPTAAPTRSPGTGPTASPTPTPTALPAVLSRGDTGEQVRDLQARLARAGTFEGTVVGNYGPVTAAAVGRYQARRALPATGTVDAATWRTLREHTRTPTEAEMHPERAVQPPATPVGPPAGLDSRCLTGRVLCADKSAHRLDWVVDGKVRMTLTVRFGRPSLPTTNGVFTVYWKDIDHTSSIYDDAPMPYAMFFHGGEAVHFSSDFVADGFGGPGGSHGCINTRSRAQTAQLFDEVHVGDAVVVHQ